MLPTEELLGYGVGRIKRLEATMETPTPKVLSQVHKTLTDNPDGMTTAAIHLELGFNAPLIRRSLQTLKARGLAKKTDSKRKGRFPGGTEKLLVVWLPEKALPPTGDAWVDCPQDRLPPVEVPKDNPPTTASIIDVIKQRGPAGASDTEVDQILGWAPGTTSNRRPKLEKAGEVQFAGFLRRAKGGSRRTKVWTLTETEDPDDLQTTIKMIRMATAPKAEDPDGLRTTLERIRVLTSPTAVHSLDRDALWVRLITIHEITSLFSVSSEQPNVPQVA